MWWFRDGAGAPPQPPPCAHPGGGRDAAPYLFPSLRLSTRCRAAAARRSRHPLAGARCSTTETSGGGFETALARLLNHRRARTPGGCRDPAPVPLPVAAPFNPRTTRSREEVSTPA